LKGSTAIMKNLAMSLPHAIEEPGDPMIVDPEPIQALDNAIDQSGETSECEDDVGSDNGDSEPESGTVLWRKRVFPEPLLLPSPGYCAS